MAPSHPYYPRHLRIDGYTPQALHFAAILGGFGAACAAVMVATWVATGRARRGLSTGERALAAWLVATGLIHLVVEGYVVVTPGFVRAGAPALPLAEIWREYSKADSRYVTRDAFVVCMEAITAFAWGPLCLAAARGVARRAPWRHVAVLVASTGQLYGDVLYYATVWFEGFVHSRPEFLYFWVYFVIINAIWVAVPAACCAWAGRALVAAVAKAEGKAKRR